MRTLFITYELPPVGGGGGRAALHVARRLARRGHEVKILTSRFGGLPERESDGMLEIVRMAVRRKSADECSPAELMSFMLRSLPAASRLARAFRPAVVCAFFGIPGGPPAWWLRQRHGIPYVLALRGSDVPRPQLAGHQRLHLFTKPALRRIYRGAAAIVAVSAALREAALRVEPRVGIEVIPNGIDTAWFDGGARGRLPERLELLFVGRLRDFKGAQFIIRALPALGAALKRPVTLNIVGDGPHRAALEALAQDCAPGAVRFAGWLERESLKAAYASASLFVLPSLAEGHPNVVLEAMAMGLPCVVSDAPGVRETVAPGADGLRVATNDPAAIASSAARILSDEALWRAMSQNAAARARALSWDVVAQQYEGVLRRAAGAGGPCAI